MKNKRFFFHWVKATNLWSIHFNKTCTHIEHLICKVPCETKINKRQPVRVMQGFCKEVVIKDNKAEII